MDLNWRRLGSGILAIAISVSVGFAAGWLAHGSGSRTETKSPPVSTAATTRVPNVVGLYWDEAEDRITEANLCRGMDYPLKSKRLSADRVLSQRPIAGRVVARLSEVSLFTSSGPGPRPWGPPPSMQRPSVNPGCR
ncbi:MAG: PASTA domain-containing protein [Actinomycetota bacterium]